MTKKFVLSKIILDTPAKSFVTCTRSHNSKHGCHKCSQVGRSIQRRMAFSLVSAPLRNLATFSNREDIEHHSLEYQYKFNILEEVGIDLVDLCPLDPMHLLDLGHAKKLLSLILIKFKNKFTFLENEIEKYSHSFPNDFARSPRTLKDFPRFKATEFHLFLCYYGPILLKQILPVNEYEHFLLLFCAIRLLSHPETAIENADYAESLLSTYVDQFAQIYDLSLVNYNVHNLLHIADCVRKYGNLNQFSAYIFENFLFKLKKLIRSPSNIITQIVNRQEEIWEIVNLKYASTKKIKENKCTPTDFKNSCFMIDDIYVNILEIINVDEDVVYLGKNLKIV